MAKKSPEINASSMADIAFLLLIFFLVTTTMNVDSGIQRTLPPISDIKDDRGIDVKERNVLLVHVNMYDQVAVKGRRVDVSQIKDLAKEFIQNVNNDPSLPEKAPAPKPIKLLPNALVSRGVISLQNDRGTSYEKYIEVQNELTKAYNECRNDFSSVAFGKKYSELSDEQRDAVNAAIPMKISEAEPRNIAKQ